MRKMSLIRCGAVVRSLMHDKNIDSNTSVLTKISPVGFKLTKIEYRFFKAKDLTDCDAADHPMRVARLLSRLVRCCEVGEAEVDPKRAEEE